MTTQRKIGLVIMLVSVFILLSSYLFTTPDKRARFLQAVYYSPSFPGVVYKPRLSELVVANNGWTTEISRNSISEVRKTIIDRALTYSYEDYYDNPNFYGFTIRYSYLATTCLFFFFIGLYMLVSLKNENEK